ncbi:MAG: hypothetical protein A2W19_02255 [Spirochaetes bacterium RBG_16_49_21]|nr:MAG: hypothetical protein A2W19_02255 [Spirochaetes bacterium RBG_16_49_21]
MKITRIDIMEDLAKEFPDINEVKVIRPLVNKFIANLKGYLIAGHSVHLAEFGKFVTTIHKPKRVVSNLNGSVVVTPERRSAKLRIGDHFKKELNP